MKSVFHIVVLMIVISCSSSKSHEIMVPELHTGFYANALDQINDKLQSDPSNANLNEQKIYYCEQLDWPTNCLAALDQYKATHGMTNQLVVQYVAYYDKHERYQLLLEVVDRWSEEYKLEEQFHRYLIKSLVKTKKISRAKVELKDFLIKNTSIDDISFASTQYLNLNDTLMAMYQLGKLEKLDASNELMFDYGKILVDRGYPEKGYQILESYWKNQMENLELSKAIYKIYDLNQEYPLARTKLKPFASDTTIAFELAESYKKESLWDSAVMYIDSVIYQDQSSKEAWRKKGQVYEDRGWISYSLRFFQKVMEIDSTDTSAAKSIELIQRKIAYLQRQKFEESKVQILELESIKIKN